jgi:hypothetical protein
MAALVVLVRYGGISSGVRRSGIAAVLRTVWDGRFPRSGLPTSELLLAISTALGSAPKAGQQSRSSCRGPITQPGVVPTEP